MEFNCYMTSANIPILCLVLRQCLQLSPDSGERHHFRDASTIFFFAYKEAENCDLPTVCHYDGSFEEGHRWFSGSSESVTT